MHRELNLNVKKQLSNLNFPIVDVYDIFYKKSVEEKMQKQRFTILRLVLVAGLVWILIQLAGVAVGDTVSGAEASGRSWAGITAFLFAYLLGVGVSFTPCVWPMYPITSSIIMGTSSAKSTKRGFALSLIYVLGLALTYSVIGLLSGFFGAKVRLILQNAWIILFVAAVFIIFGLSMLGLFEIRMPASITSRLMKGKRKGIVGIFLMGLVSGIIASPCITPVVGSLVAYVAKTGDAFRGFWLFFAFALGMGTILVVIGTVSGALKALPRPGRWMVRVQRVFGVLLIAMAFYIALPLLRSSGADVKEQPVVVKEKVEIEWIKDINQGLECAGAEHKPVMIDFYADWCYYCKVLDKKTFPDARVIKESRRFIMIKFDVTHNTPEDRKFIARYQIKGFPTLIFIDTAGNIHPLIGYRDADALLSFMRKIN